MVTNSIGENCRGNCRLCIFCRTFFFIVGILLWLIGGILVIQTEWRDTLAMPEWVAYLMLILGCLLLTLAIFGWIMYFWAAQIKKRWYQEHLAMGKGNIQQDDGATFIDIESNEMFAAHSPLEEGPTNVSIQTVGYQHNNEQDTQVAMLNETATQLSAESKTDVVISISPPSESGEEPASEHEEKEIGSGHEEEVSEHEEEEIVSEHGEKEIGSEHEEEVSEHEEEEIVSEHEEKKVRFEHGEEEIIGSEHEEQEIGSEQEEIGSEQGEEVIETEHESVDENILQQDSEIQEATAIGSDNFAESFVCLDTVDHEFYTVATVSNQADSETEFSDVQIDNVVEEITHL